MSVGGMLRVLPRRQESDYSEQDPRLQSFTLDGSPKRVPGDDEDDASSSGDSGDSCGIRQGIPSADPPSPSHRSLRDCHSGTFILRQVSAATEVLTDPSAPARQLSDAAKPPPETPELPFQGKSGAYAMTVPDDLPLHHHGAVSRWPLLWLAAGPCLGIALSTVGYGVWDMHTPFQWGSWWRCAVPCATVWLWLETSRLIVDFHYLLLLPRRPGPSHVSRRPSMCLRASHALPDPASRSFARLPAKACPPRAARLPQRRVGRPPHRAGLRRARAAPRRARAAPPRSRRGTPRRRTAPASPAARRSTCWGRPS